MSIADIPTEVLKGAINWAQICAMALAILAACAGFLGYVGGVELGNRSDKEVAGAKAVAALASQEAAKATLGAATANERAALAQRDTERAKLETAQVSERLLLTQARLDSANEVTPFSKQQLDLIVQRLKALPLGDTQPVWGAANDHQAQRRLLQLSAALFEADLKIYTQAKTVGSFVAPEGEKGDVLVHYWSDERRSVAEAIATVFREAGVEAHAYLLPPEADNNARDATRTIVLVGIAARPAKSFLAD